MNFKDTILASLVPILLGFGFVIAKPAMEYFPPMLLTGLRFVFAASILIWWFPIPKGFLKKIFIASLIANTLQYGLTYTGLSFIDASAAVLLVQTEVPFGVIFAYFMLKEKPTIRSLVGITIAFVGVYVLTGSPNLDGKFFGVSLIIIAPPINNSLVGSSPKRKIAANNPVGGIPMVTIGNTLYKGLFFKT